MVGGDDTSLLASSGSKLEVHYKIAESVLLLKAAQDHKLFSLLLSTNFRSIPGWFLDMEHQSCVTANGNNPGVIETGNEAISSHLHTVLLC